MDELFATIQKRMDGAISSLQHDLRGLRTGRASASLLEHVMVEAYGSMMPLQQVATITVPEARLMMVQVWDKAMVKPVERGIAAADLGLNPQVEGTNIRIPTPPLSEERRQELVKVAHRYGENAKVAIRNVRRDAMDQLKKSEKSHSLSQDESRAHADKIQKLTDEHIATIDQLLHDKERDILTMHS